MSGSATQVGVAAWMAPNAAAAAAIAAAVAAAANKRQAGKVREAS